jgi:hypothetical protein
MPLLEARAQAAKRNRQAAARPHLTIVRNVSTFEVEVAAMKTHVSTCRKTVNAGSFGTCGRLEGPHSGHARSTVHQ